MAKKKSGEQGMLLDVAPKNQKALAVKAKAYREKMLERKAALDEEIQLKAELLAMVKEAGVQEVDGKIVLNVDDVTITVKHRDELIQVKEKGESEAE